MLVEFVQQQRKAPEKTEVMKIKSISLGSCRCNSRLSSLWF